MKQPTTIFNYLSFVLKGSIANLSLSSTFLFSIILIFLTNLLSKALLNFTLDATGDAFLIQLKAPPTTAYVIVAVTIMPFYEEVMFRLFLHPKSTKIVISTSLILGLFISYVLGHVYDLSPFLLVVVLPITLSPLVALLIVTPFKKGLYPFKRVSVLSRLEYALTKDIRPVYYLSAILFSAAHIAFQTLFFTMPSPVVLVMSINYFLVGLVLGNVRISKGIIYSIIIHSFVNVIAYFNVLIR